MLLLVKLFLNSSVAFFRGLLEGVLDLVVGQLAEREPVKITKFGSTKLLGTSVSVSDDLALIGAPFEDEIALGAGAAYSVGEVGCSD